MNFVRDTIIIILSSILITFIITKDANFLIGMVGMLAFMYISVRIAGFIDGMRGK